MHISFKIMFMHILLWNVCWKYVTLYFQLFFFSYYKNLYFQHQQYTSENVVCCMFIHMFICIYNITCFINVFQFFLMYFVLHIVFCNIFLLALPCLIGERFITGHVFTNLKILKLMYSIAKSMKYLKKLSLN